MSRVTPHARNKRLPAFEALERRAMLDAAPNEITALYGGGFGPTALHLNDSASLAGTRLRLTDGGSNEASSAFYMSPVDIGGDFTTTFQFQFTPVGSEPIGNGFTFMIQNSAAYSAHDTTGLHDDLGVNQDRYQFAVTFETYNDNPGGVTGGEFSDNATGIVNKYSAPPPGFNWGGQVDIPKTSIDFHSNDVFQAQLRYTAPAAGNPGHLDETLTDVATLKTWSHTYDGLDLSSIFRLKDVTGQYAYAGFTASTGSPSNDGAGYVVGKGRATQDILNWKWYGGGGAAAAMPYGASFSLAGPQVTAGSVYDAGGNPVRTLWQDSPLPAGTYHAEWDGLDQYGLPVDPAKNPGPYTFKVVESRAVFGPPRVIAGDTADPASYSARLGSLRVYGVAVRPDGSAIWAGTYNGDTTGQGFLKQLDVNGFVNGTATADLAAYYIGGADALDGNDLYMAAEVPGFSGHWGVVKINTVTHDINEGFTHQNNSNPDGSSVDLYLNQYMYLHVPTSTPVQHWNPLSAIAVTDGPLPGGGSLWVADLDNNLVHRYDKVTGDQIGTPIGVPDPAAIAADASGNLWVAHGTGGAGPANQIAVYSPAGVFLQNLDGVRLADASSMAIVGGKLYVADHGAGHVLVYTISAGTPNARVGVTLALTVGGPASYGHDDGKSDFWDLRSVTADNLGDIYTTQQTISPDVRSPGTQVEKWSPSGTPVWVRGGYEYQSVGGFSTPGDPTTVYSSSLHRYKIDPVTGAWQYTGSVAYPGWDTNKWSGLTTTVLPAAPHSVTLGGVDFLALSTGDRVIFYRVNPDGSFHPSAIVGGSGLADGNAWTWVDSSGDGVPQDGQIADSGSNPGNHAALTVDGAGNIWYQTNSMFFELTLKGLDARGNPVYDWGRAVKLFTMTGRVEGFAVQDDGLYVLYEDPGIGPETSLSVYDGWSNGGANALCKYDRRGNFLWTIPLPDYMDNVAGVPGGGVILASLWDSYIFQVTGDGQLTGHVAPSLPDVMDIHGGGMTVSRDPLDGLVDVFTENIGVSAFQWFRIDDRAANPVLRGTAARGGTVTLTAGVPAPAAVSLLPADDTGVVGDGVTSVRLPRMTGTAEPGAVVQLLDAAGAVLGSAVAGGAGAFTVAPSSPLADGAYALRVREVDAAGNVGAAGGSFTLVIDTAAPAAPSVPSILAADNTGPAGGGLTSVRQPHLVGTAPVGTSVELLGTGGAVLETAAVGPGGTYSVAPAAPLTDATYQVKVVALDVAGNASAASPTFNLTVITTAPPTPAAPALAPADDSGVVGDNLTNVRRPHVVGSGALGVSVRVVGADGSVLGTGAVGATGSYSVLLASPLADGSYALTLQVIDIVGNFSAASPALTLTVDGTAPAAPPAPTLAPSDDSGVKGDGLTNVTRPHLTGNAEPGATVQLLDAASVVIGSATAGAGGSYSVAPSAALADGSYPLRVQAVDAAGNAGAPGGSFTLTVSTALPPAPSALALLSADATGAPSAGVTSVRQAHLTGTAQANATVQLLGPSNAVLGVGTAGAGGSFSVQVASPLADGVYTLRAAATDLAGNVGPAGPAFTLTVRTPVSPPAAPSTPGLLAADDTGAVGDGLTSVNRPHLTGTGTAGTTVQIVNGSGAVLGTGVVAADGSYSVAPASPLADGVYALQARAVDAAGNPSAPSAAFNLTVDTTAPAAPPAPALLAADDSGTKGDGLTNVNVPHLTGSAEAGATVQLINGTGVVLGAARAAADGRYSVQPLLPLADGSVFLQTRAVDAAGNAGPLSPPLTLAVLATPPAAPAAPAISPLDDTGVAGDGRTAVRRPRVVGTVSAGQAVDLLDPNGIVLASTTAALTTGAYTLQPAASLNAGSFPLRVRVRDAAGNVSPAGPALGLTVVDAASTDLAGGGKSELAVFRPATAQWITSPSSGGGALVTSFGGPNLMDIPVPGDYDGTGRAETAVFRPATAQWFILGPGGARVVTFGAPNLSDIPVPGDYDGVGYAEPAVFRPGTSQWFVLGPGGGHLLGAFGAPNLSDIPVPGDYDGVGYAEPAVFRPGTSQWFVLGPGGGHLLGAFGAPNLSDIPVPGDYDGTGHTEMAVFRPSTAQWFASGPGGGHLLGTFGAANFADLPIAGPIASLNKLRTIGGSRPAALTAAAATAAAAETIIAPARPAVTLPSRGERLRPGREAALRAALDALLDERGRAVAAPGASRGHAGRGPRRGFVTAP